MLDFAGGSPRAILEEACLGLVVFPLLFAVWRQGLRGRSPWHVLLVPFPTLRVQGLGEEKAVRPLLESRFGKEGYGFHQKEKVVGRDRTQRERFSGADIFHDVAHGFPGPEDPGREDPCHGEPFSQEDPG